MTTETTNPTTTEQARKPDFYARLLTERPQDAAGILATLCRRKDKALRSLAANMEAGFEPAEVIGIALEMAFPKRKEANN